MKVSTRKGIRYLSNDDSTPEHLLEMKDKGVDIKAELMCERDFEVCRCDCHREKDELFKMMHCMPCCRTCDKCDKRISNHSIDSHAKKCGKKYEDS